MPPPHSPKCSLHGVQENSAGTACPSPRIGDLSPTARAQADWWASSPHRGERSGWSLRLILHPSWGLLHPRSTDYGRGLGEIQPLHLLCHLSNTASHGDPTLVPGKSPARGVRPTLAHKGKTGWAADVCRALLHLNGAPWKSAGCRRGPEAPVSFWPTFCGPT